ncbi:MAG: hypothetical protein ACRENN_00730, partial [Candidatus Eiseniibacteriota bacterium]
MAVLLVCFGLVFPKISPAQYMFLDTNGDGLSTPADVVNSSGPTTLDVWLRTDLNRDGSTAVCSTQDGALNIFSYEFILHASSGTLSWRDFINRRPTMGQPLGESKSDTDYRNGYAGGVPLAPGAYLLASVTIEVTAATPEISIVASTPLSPNYLTEFSSSCSGNDFDNTLKLGSDWRDADGIPYGGSVNTAPVLAQPDPVLVPEGSIVEKDLHATDTEGDPVSFSLLSGPPFVAVTTVDPGTGAGLGRLRVSPGPRDAGHALATIE